MQPNIYNSSKKGVTKNDKKIFLQFVFIFNKHLCDYYANKAHPAAFLQEYD